VRHIVLINPRFDPSYWGMEYALPIVRKRSAMPVAALPLLAALTPPEYRITIVDENVDRLDYDSVARADLVALTGMSVQRRRMTEILTELKRRGVFTVVGGPWVTVKEDYFGSLADAIFVGEAEESWPRFLADWSAGRHHRRYEQAEKTDMSRVPLPRYDLLKMQHYLFGSIQLSRGCPFQCEFCDIIVTFGRRPRFKTIGQVLAELDELKRQKMEIVFIVDDNLIGNRQFIRSALPEIIAWQKRNGFPFIFAAEASLDLAEEDDIMRMMIEANILSVFIGIESPNEEALRETKKFQNVSKKIDLLARVHTVQKAGLEVWCGMILGFDHDDASIFRWQSEFLAKSRITEAMIGMLYAIPTTPLYARLAKEGRLDSADTSESGTNVLPLKMSREELSAGYVDLMRTVYQPDAYFARLEEFLSTETYQFAPGHAAYLRHHPAARLFAEARCLLGAAFLFWQLMRHVSDPLLRKEYRARLRGAIARRRQPALWLAYALKCAMHYHFFAMANQTPTGSGGVVNSYQ
jgi:radical SAM superfamily enzyme YgiQ (UPF0313 family)